MLNLKEQLELFRLEIAKTYYVKHSYSTAPNEYENIARKSFKLADVFVKVYKEALNGTTTPASAYVKGGHQ